MRCYCPQTLGISSDGLGLCNDCLALFARDDVASLLKSRSGLRFNRQPYDATKMKCDLCFFLSARYFKKSILAPKWDGGDDDFWGLRRLFAWVGKRRLTCRIRGDLRTDDPLEVERWDGWWPLKNRYLRLSVDRDSSLANDIACRPVITDLKFDRTYALIQEWLAECDEQHEDCFSHLPPTKLAPTHLIRVDASENIVILEKVDSLAHFPKYAALSYVWGSPQPYKTTTQNYESYRNGIPLASLGKCLQDAIWVTRKLNIPFVWIDALCIVQDLVNDKMHEIARMDSIFSFAYVTLSASHISSSAESFLSTSPLKCIHRLSGVEIPFRSSSTKAQLRVLYSKEDGYNNDWREDLEPIHSRAWTFQEHFMSPRMLLFKDFQLFWVCTKVRGRDGGWMAPDEVQSYGQQWTMSRRTLRSPLPEDWENICQSYALRKLTDPNDKLSALSSVASYFATTGSKSYAAGIWMSHYVDQLAWTAHKSAFGIVKRPQVWTAPSWSWASLDCPISFRAQDDKDLGIVTIPYLRPGVVSWRVEPVFDAAKFGQLKSAFLRIHGRLLTSRPRKTERGYKLRGIESPPGSIDTPDAGLAHLSFDLEPEDGSISGLPTIRGIEPWDGLVHCLLLQVNVEGKLASQMSENIAGIKEDKVYELFCLALRLLPNGDFHRVGQISVAPRENGKGWLRAFEQAEERTITII